MWKKKKEEPVAEKNKVVYDVEKDKSKGLLDELLTQSMEQSQEDELDEVKNNLNEFTEETEEDEKHRTKRIILGIVMFLLVLAMGVIMWATSTELFYIKNINIQNGIHVSSGEIMAIVSGDYDKNIFIVGLGRIKRNVEKNPYVGRVIVKRNLPNTLEISFTEREPYAVIEFESGDCLVDQYGYVLDNSYELLGSQFPRLYSVLGQNYSAGALLEGTDIVRYKQIIYLLEAAENMQFGYSISSIGFEDSENIKFKIDDVEIEVLYGTLKKEQVNDKLLYLKEIIRKSKEQNLKGYLDMSADNYYEKSVLNSKI